ncbi:MAG: hypothetical protein JWO36_5611 [Myxococcales bacterium]|nr:hypothetical protein [Myxococcales bacterium]
MGTRPGSDDHKPCDLGNCHQKAFLAAPSSLCKVCHVEIKTAPLAAPLRPYPIEDPWQAEPPRFSHQLHLDSLRMEARVGFHVACVDCHVRDGKLARPDHATCARCHAPEAKLPGALNMNDCAGCHDRGVRQRTRARLIRDDLKFDHGVHRADGKGIPIRCEQCHAQSTAATSVADHPPPRIETCVSCHDDSNRTPNSHRMRVCGGCHTNRTNNLTTIAPRNHLAATERPLDHTLAFRRDHIGPAERDAARCATCHTQMSGNPRDACDECHQTMLPGDHRITWRELDHGPEAAADQTRCARCHVVEFCTACHSQRPRSHGAGGTFISDHGPLARFNVRSCVTCHAENFCLTCHRGVR